MKGKFLTCAGSLVLLVIVLVAGGIAGFKLLQGEFQRSVLEEMGFASQEEYDAFTAKLNEPYDETGFYQNTYTDADKVAVRESLRGSVVFADGEQLFLSSGDFNLAALEKENNASLTGAVAFTFGEYSCFSQLLLSSIYNYDTESNAQLKDIQILSFVVNADETHTLVMKLATDTMKASMKTYGEGLPDKLYLTFNYSLVVNAGEFEAVNVAMRVNALDDATNEKCNSFLNNVFGVRSFAKTFANVFVDLTNTFDLTISASTTFAVGGVTKAPKLEA